MMKNIISILILLSLFSCKKSFLEVVPLGSQVASTADDYDKLMNDPSLYFYPAGGWQEMQLMGDEAAAEASFFNGKNAARESLFQWKDVIYQPGSATPYMLNSLITQMYGVNKVIAEVMDAKDGSSDTKKRIRGEALATRAWVHFQLINFYAKPYLASSASTDPGFPLLSKADVTQESFPRGTVQGVYDFIIKDLTEAIPNLPVKAAARTRMSRPAAEGLLGKVYMFMGKYNEALPLLKAALDDITLAGVPTLYNYNQAFGTGGVFLPIDPINGPKTPGQNYTDFTESVVFKTYDSGPYNGTQLGNDGLVLTTQVASLFDVNDKRLLLYTVNDPDNNPNAHGRLRKYAVSYTRFGLELPELYLLSAECKARVNDLIGAKNDLETLRKHRMPTDDATIPSAIAADKTSLIKFSIDERIREFAMEGYRWFDMRRLYADPVFQGMSFTHTLYNIDGTSTIYMLNAPNRLVLRIPPAIIDRNPDMPNNP